MRLLAMICVLAFLPSAIAQPGKGNRLAYLDEVDPYYPSHTFPKLTTPMWVGDKDVEAVVILAIDDMKDSKKYETFLRPILRRLKEIDGRAPVSIMSCAVDPKDPQLQTWLKEGLSFENHTIDHPCPFFKIGYEKAFATFERCYYNLTNIPGNRSPVAFRMPCCDSLNTPSPRFWYEMFPKTHHTIDSSVFNVFTSDDAELPKELVLADDKERFRKYLPVERSFVNYIQNYPYPYLIGHACWQFPCVTPSDWQAQNLHKANNPATVADWKMALDCTVIKKGVFCLVFHPHGWIKSDQVVDLVDYAARKYGKKVKFLNFREALGCINNNLLHDNLNSREWRDNSSTCLIDLNNDGYLDIVNNKTRLWLPKENRWQEFNNPWSGVGAKNFCIVQDNGLPSYFSRSPTYDKGGEVVEVWDRLWHFDGKDWKYDQSADVKKKVAGRDDARFGFLFRDIDGDGKTELISTGGQVFQFAAGQGWKKLPFRLPANFRIDPRIKKFGLGYSDLPDPGFRFLDLDGDGKLDVLFSHDEGYGLYLFTDMQKGWSKKVVSGDKGVIPLIARGWSNNGFWVHSGHLWWANEDTVLLKNHVDKRSIKDLLRQK